MAGVTGPAERDAFSRQRLDHRPPFGDPFLIRAQIGDVGGDVGPLGLERQRQAAERTMHIKGGKRFAARMAGRNAVEAGKECLQLGLHFEHDTRAGARQQRRIAGELDAVAQALLGMQQDRLVTERKFAEPERAAIVAARVGHAAAFPAPFVLRKAVPQVAHSEQRQRLIEMGVGIILLQRDGLAEARHRLVVPVERFERAAAIVPGAPMRGNGGECAVEGGHGLGMALKLQQRVAAIVEDIRMAGRNLKRGIEIGQRLGVTFERRQRHAAIEQGFAVAGASLHDLLEAAQGFPRAAQCQQGAAAILQRVQVARINRQRLVEAIERVGVALERVQHVRKIDQRIGAARIDLERRRDQPQRFAHLPGLRLDRAEQMQRIEIIRRSLQHAGIEFFRLAQPALPVQADGVLQGLRDVESGWLHGGKIAHGRQSQSMQRR